MSGHHGGRYACELCNFRRNRPRWFIERTKRIDDMSNPIIGKIRKLDQSQLNDFVQGRVQASCFEVNKDTHFELLAGRNCLELVPRFQTTKDPIVP